MTVPTRVLAVECATSACSVAVTVGGQVTGAWRREARQGHAAFLLPGVLEAMDVAGLDFADLDLIAAGVGPGSFTGLRIGLAAARGIALAAALPLAAATSCEAVAEAVRAEAVGRPIAVLIDSRRGDLFLQLFAPDGRAAADPTVVTAEALADHLPGGPLLVAGDGVYLAQAAGLWNAGQAGPDSPLLRPQPPDAAAVARVAIRRHLGQLPELVPRPLYLRAPEARPRSSP